MTLREAKTIIFDMYLAETTRENYEALGVAIEAIEQWINDGTFPTSAQYIKKREKSIAGAERLAESKGKGDAVLKTYIYDAGFCDGYMRKTPKQKS